MEHWIKKWHYWPIRNDEFGRPVFPHVYDIGYRIKMFPNTVDANINYMYFEHLELLANTIQIDSDTWYRVLINDLKKSKQQFVLNELNNDIIVEFELSKLDNNRLGFLYNLPFILDENIKEEGEYEFDIFKIIVNKLNYRDREIIEVNK